MAAMRILTACGIPALPTSHVLALQPDAECMWLSMGVSQHYDAIGDQFYKKAGYNEMG